METRTMTPIEGDGELVMEKGYKGVVSPKISQRGASNGNPWEGSPHLLYV